MTPPNPPISSPTIATHSTHGPGLDAHSQARRAECRSEDACADGGSGPSGHCGLGGGGGGGSRPVSAARALGGYPFIEGAGWGVWEKTNCGHDGGVCVMNLGRLDAARVRGMACFGRDCEGGVGAFVPLESRMGDRSQGQERRDGRCPRACWVGG